jgi:short-subunit dehydrogenase
MTQDLTNVYGQWAIIAGGSDGVGIAFAHGLAERGMNVVLVARRVEVLQKAGEEIRARHQVEVRTVSLDLSSADALSDLAHATSDLEVGIFIYNAGGDEISRLFLEKDLATH